MESSCYRPEDLGEILELAEAHPRRSHAASCPRCRAVLATYVEFRAAPPAVTGPRLEAALSRLDHSLDQEIGGDPVRRPEAGARSWFDWGRLLRPALAVAAVLLAVIVVDIVRRPSPERGIVLRSEQPDAGAFLPAPPRPQADGSLELSWPAVTGADSYRVRLFHAELSEIAAFDTSRNGLRLSPEQVRKLLPPAGVYAVSVTALNGGDELDRSRPRSFRLQAGD